jgi:hypothetical protein
MKFVKLYLIEGVGYYVKRNIKLPVTIDAAVDAPHCFTNTQSPSNIIVIILLRMLGKKVYFLPDGIFEYSNIKRKKNILGYISLKISNGVLVGDKYSDESAKYIGMSVVKVGRWQKAALDKMDMRGNKIIIATAKTPFFFQNEEHLLKTSLSKVVDDLADKSKILTSMPESMFNELSLTAFGIKNLSKCSSMLPNKEIGKVISAPSTLIIEALANNISCSLLPFRAHDYRLLPNYNYPNEFNYNDFVFCNLEHGVKIQDSYFLAINIIEQSIKKIIKYISGK